MRGSVPHITPVEIAITGDAERYAQGVRNAIGLGALAAAHFVLAWWYGDQVQQLLFGSFALIGPLFALATRRLSDSATYRLGLLVNIPCTLLLQVVIPADVRTVALLLPFGLVVFAAMLTVRGAFVVFGSVALMSMVGDVSGLTPGVQSPIPAFASVLVTLSVTLLGAVQGLYARNLRTLRSRRLVAEHQSALAVEDERLARDRAQLETSTAELERETATLEQLRARQAKLTVQLSVKRAEERAMINAIHQDLREPLRSVVSFGQLIERRIASSGDTDAVGDSLGYAVDGGRRMAVMLDDLLRYANATEPGAAEPVDLGEVVDGACRDLRNIIERTGARVEVDAASLPLVYGQVTQLTQLFLNLLTNALKFARPGEAPAVRIRGRESDSGGVAVEVTDAGIGIPSAQLAQVFGLFNRAHDADGYEGSGVGLALCRRIAIAHGADLGVSSEEGRGTTFTLSFAPASLLARAPSLC